MKVIKLALLGTAALAAVSVSARADDLSALKAQIEALQADVAALQAAPAVPAGYQLLTISEADRIVVPGLEVRDSHGQSKTATTIGILPTADVPASTVIQWSGSVRAALAYYDNDETGTDASVTLTAFGAEAPNDADGLRIRARGRIDVTGTTDTAVGEVGASMSIYADFSNNMAGGIGFTSNSAAVSMDYAWGWWKMTPELTFAGGYAGSLASIGMGMAKVNDAYISRGSTDVSGGDMTQMRLSYASGPVGVAIALEHTDDGDNVYDPPLSRGSDTGSSLGVAGELTYSGDMFNAELAGFLRDADSNGSIVAGGKVTQSQIGLGLGANLSDMFHVSAAASLGNNVWFNDSVSNGTTANIANSNHVGDGWEASVAAVATLSDSVSAEVGVGFSSYDENLTTLETETMAVAGGVYWSPVSQLKMGVQASWVDVDNTATGVNYIDSEELAAAFVTWWNF